MNEILLPCSILFVLMITWLYHEFQVMNYAVMLAQICQNGCLQFVDQGSFPLPTGIPDVKLLVVLRTLECHFCFCPIGSSQFCVSENEF